MRAALGRLAAALVHLLGNGRWDKVPPKAISADPEGPLWLQQAGKPPSSLEQRDFYESVEGQPGVTDITELDTSDVEELRKIYLSSEVIPPEQLDKWATESAEFRVIWQRVNDQLDELEAEILPKPVDDGYRPVAGLSAGTSANKGVVYPPKVAEEATKAWADLVLERYRLTGLPLTLPTGVSMRKLDEMRRRAQARTATVTEVALLRQRGLI